MASAIVWLRRDLRLTDQPALSAAIEAGYTPLLVYIHAPDEAADWAPGAASLAWLDRSLRALDDDIRMLGSRLIVRRGPSLSTLRSLITELSVDAVFWNRLYEPALRERDALIKAALREDGLTVQSFNAAQLVEPWQVETGQGTPYRVFTPFWKTALGKLEELPAIASAPESLPPPPDLVKSLSVDALDLRPVIDWDRGFWDRWTPGERGARERLDAFLDDAVERYSVDRDRPDLRGTSTLSPHLHFGEISPRQCVQAVRERRWDEAARKNVNKFVSELGWREFSVHLMYHYPETPKENLNPKFEDFVWATPDPDILRRWQRGRTGVPIVDAGMRELWQTGWMHNRVRMIVASLLTKNLRYHWRHGADWFWDTLVDADLANNTQGWQWTAGTGADASPYFRIFNPVTQGKRFDPCGDYVRRYVPELAKLPDSLIHEPWSQPEQAARLAPDYPAQPIVDLSQSRNAALEAYSASRSD